MSIQRRVVRAQLLWSVLWGGALALAVGLAVDHAVDELLDDSLQSAAEGLIGPLVRNLSPAWSGGAPAAASASRSGSRFVWQLVEHADGARVLLAAGGAPAEPLRDTPSAGFSDAPGWRIFGSSNGRDGQMLYVAQAVEARLETQREVALAVLLASLPMALLGLPWLRARVRHELQPLQALSERLRGHDPLQPGATLGATEIEELQPVQAAIDALGQRLARRVGDERAFTAHAAHALRTPLAGIDAQLAVALREAPAALVPRLQRVRAAAVRLQRVVTALLTMFRSGFELRRSAVALSTLAAAVAIDGPTLSVAPESAGAVIEADADLLTATLLNLVDNAQQHGASHVVLSLPAPGVLRVLDDGRGVDATRRDALQQALDAQDYEGRTGLGLMLADRVARAHGGRLRLPALASGFAAELHLPAAAVA